LQISGLQKQENMMEDKKFVPFGKEWEKDILKMNKYHIMMMLKDALIKTDGAKAKVNVKVVVMQLHKEAELIEKEAALHYGNKELHNMHTKMDLARSLRTVANYLDGVQSA